MAKRLTHRILQLLEQPKDLVVSNTPENERMLKLTAQIVSAHVSHNSITSDALPALITSIFNTLSSVGQEPAKPKLLNPAVPIKSSVHADYIVCLEDGKRLKMLKRHLATSYQLTPDEYRQKWGLPSDYPMVAPNYTATRSSLARQIGLGRKPAAPAPVVEVIPEPEPPAPRKKAIAKPRKKVN